MNILFISKLSGNLWAGPNNSVPAQVLAQSQIDNVFWYNINNICREEWKQNGLHCFCLKDYPSGRIVDLPYPFNRPDIAIVEEVYCYPFEKIIFELQKSRIPYVVVPRSTLTEKAQNNKRLKKIIGNLLFFNKMIKKSAAIQYLSEQEERESIKRWKKKCFVIPNGITIPVIKKESGNTDGIRATYIGRIEIYQKGLDMLLKAISDIKDSLRNMNFKLSLYGPSRDGADEILKKILKEENIEDIVSLNDSVLKEKKEKVLLDTDVFIMTSRFEGLPMGLIEALAYSIPCVVTKGTNMADKIDAFQAGWISDNSIEGIKKALLKMINEKKQFNKYGSNAKKLAEDHSWEKIAKESHNKYMEIS